MSHHISDDSRAVLPKPQAKIVRLEPKRPRSIHDNEQAPLKTIDHRRYAATSLNRVPDPNYGKTCVIMVDQNNRIMHDGKIFHY